MKNFRPTVSRSAGVKKMNPFTRCKAWYKILNDVGPMVNEGVTKSLMKATDGEEGYR